MTQNTDTSEFQNDILSPRVLWVTSCFDHIWEITFLAYGTQRKLFIRVAHVSDLYLLTYWAAFEQLNIIGGWQFES